MKRKGRRHLPKVGTRPSIEYGVQEHRARGLDPFATDPSRRRRTPGTALIALAIAALIAIGVIALVVVTT
jgi:predicted N-acetyltransferase YhbS